MIIEPASVERILQRMSMARNGSATALRAGAWTVEIEDDSEPPIKLTWTQGVDPEGLELDCDAPLERYTTEQSVTVAAFLREFATALNMEKIRFASFAAVAAFIDERFEADVHPEEGFIVLGPSTETPVSITNPRVSREPWIEVSVAFPSDANPAWLLERNGELTSVRFERANDSVGLVAALPLSAVTAQRLLDMIDDVTVMHEVLLEEYEEDDEDEEGEGDEDDDEVELWQGSGIVGPWQDKTTCMRALDDSLLRSGFLKLANRELDCEIAHVHRIGDTMWITVEPPILADLAKQLPEPKMFAVDVELDAEQERATRAHLIELSIDEDGDVLLHEALGSEPEVRDVETAVRGWELRLAARASAVAETAPVTTRPVYYRAL